MAQLKKFKDDFLRKYRKEHKTLVSRNDNAFEDEAPVLKPRKEMKYQFTA